MNGSGYVGLDPKQRQRIPVSDELVLCIKGVLMKTPRHWPEKLISWHAIFQRARFSKEPFMVWSVIEAVFFLK